jgi:hypothetical protein
MRWSFALAVALLCLAGCASPRPAGDHPGDATQGHGVDFGAPILVGKNGLVETSLAVGSNGTILACSNGGFVKPPPLWASIDGGKTFATVAAGETTSGGDCDVAVANATWYEIYTITDVQQNDSAVPAAPAVALSKPSGFRLATSHDAGKTWTITSPMPDAKFEDRPWITVNGETVDITYVPTRPAGSTCIVLVCASADSVVFTRSTDGGRSWSPPVTVYGDASKPTDISYGHPIESADGKSIGMAIGDTDSTNDATRPLRYAYSNDGGVTWAASTVFEGPTFPIIFPSATQTRDGLLTVGFATGTPKSASVDVAVSSDHGKTWSKPIVATSKASFAANNMWASVELAPGPGGNVTVAWLEASGSGAQLAWSLHAAVLDPRAMSVVDGPRTVAFAGSGPGAFEFMEAGASPSGDLLILYPAYRSDCGRETDGRLDQCVELVAAHPR